MSDWNLSDEEYFRKYNIDFLNLKNSSEIKNEKEVRLLKRILDVCEEEQLWVNLASEEDVFSYTNTTNNYRQELELDLFYKRNRFENYLLKQVNF